MKPVLPLVAVSNDTKLEPQAVKQYEIHGSDGVHLLDLVTELNVLCDATIKVHNFGVLVAPPLEEHVLLGLPYHSETTYIVHAVYIYICM